MVAIPPSTPWSTPSCRPTSLHLPGISAATSFMRSGSSGSLFKPAGHPGPPPAAGPHPSTFLGSQLLPHSWGLGALVHSSNQLDTLVHPQLQAHIPPPSWDLSCYLIHEVWELWFTLQTSWVFTGKALAGKTCTWNKAKQSCTNTVNHKKR